MAASAAPASASAEQRKSKAQLRKERQGELETLIKPFHGTAQPTASRVVTDVAQVKPNPMTLLDTWKYVPFLATQATALTSAFVSHHLFGPPKKSWGIEMTLFTTALRTSVDFSYLSNIHRMRRVINLQNILPAPKDGIVTPVTFRVKRRGLKGFLADADAAEDGKRVLNGEWVINRRIWRKMQDQHRSTSRSTFGGAGAGPSASPGGRPDRVIYYLHGGAYYLMSPASHRFLTIMTSKYSECRIFALDYRLSPETVFPGALHDAVAGYMRLVYDLKIPPENIIFGGDSAGGGLCLATMLYLRDNGYPLPSGAFLMSPWVDLTMSCESWDTNANFDYLPRPADDDHMNPVKCYLGPGIGKYITHPYASPLFGDYTGLPPLLIQSGDAEVLRDEAVLLSYKASAAGVHVEHEIYEDCVHVFQAFIFLEASRQAMHSIRRYVKRTLPAHAAKQARTFDRSEQDELDAEVMRDAHAVRNADGELDARALPATPSDDAGAAQSSGDDRPTSESSSDSEEDDDGAGGRADADREPTDAAKAAAHVVGGLVNAGAAASQAVAGANADAGTAGGGAEPMGDRIDGGASTASLPRAGSSSRLRKSTTSLPSAAAAPPPLDSPASPASPKRPTMEHKRSMTEAYGALPMRLRNSSHPDIRALVERFSHDPNSDAASTTLHRDGAHARSPHHHHRDHSHHGSRSSLAHSHGGGPPSASLQASLNGSANASKTGSRVNSAVNSAQNTDDEGEFASFAPRTQRQRRH